MRRILVLLIAAIALVAAACDDKKDDSKSDSSTTTTAEASSTTVADSSTTVASDGEPPCTSEAILTALQVADSTVTSVNDFACGDGWAGASYSNPEFDSAALLKADGDTWVQADRTTECSDSSIPEEVQHYCEVS